MAEIKIKKHKQEDLYLFIGFIFFALSIYFFYDLNPLISALVIIIGLIYIRLVQGQYLGNALQVSDKHFFRLKQMARQQSIKLEINEPKVFIYQDPSPNAYTLGYRNPYAVILASTLVENLSEEELESVIAHELGHIKLNHSRILSFISPAGQNIPVFSWLFSFWQRSSELSADNVSLITTENPRALVTALIKISIGTKFLSMIDEDELLKQSKEINENRMNRLGELLNNHPYLTRRISNILAVAQTYGFHYYKSDKMFCIDCGAEIGASSKFVRIAEPTKEAKNRMGFPEIKLKNNAN